MTSPETRNVAEISPSEARTRKIITAIGSKIFRFETIGNIGSLEKAEKLVGEGYNVIVINSHPSEGDSPRGLMRIFRLAIMGKMKIIAPIAYHENKFVYRTLAKWTGITLGPIVTQSTINKGKADGHKLNYGMPKYTDDLVKMFRERAILDVSPQGERQTELAENPDKNTIATTLREIKWKGRYEKPEINLDKTVFLFFGFGIKGEKDYFSRKGVEKLNWGKKYTLNVGACLTYKEFLTRATELAEKAGVRSGKKENPIYFIDQVIYDELNKVVPEEYKDTKNQPRGYKWYL